MKSPSRQAGATYLLMLFAVAALGLGLAAFGTVWSTAAQREREAELLFIGGEFARALASYRASSPAGTAAYPQRLEDLLLDPRQPFVRRHLRRLYRDPMTGEADWLVDRRDGQIVAVRSRSTRPVLRRSDLPPWVVVTAQGEATRHTDWQMRPADEGLATPPAAPAPGR
ncbi:type II secretion system protein [Zoogloea sp.]|uniref:type II secretion system protein n=1 Tax=Zoogloea sp. TaxID=49181 RepID=UPI0035B0121D